MTDPQSTLDAQTVEQAVAEFRKYVALNREAAVAFQRYYALRRDLPVRALLSLQDKIMGVYSE